MKFLSALSLIQTAMYILKGVLASIPDGAQYQVYADGVQAAITELQKVHGTEVSDKQLQELKITKQW